MNAKKIPLLMVLLIAAIGAVVFSWRQSRPSTPATAQPLAPGSSSAALIESADAALTAVQTQLVSRAEQLGSAAWPEKIVLPAEAPEPVEASEEAPPQHALPRLSGVAKNGDQIVAFLNGRIVSVGESVEGYEVVEIANESVVLRDASGEKTTLRLYGSP